MGDELHVPDLGENEPSATRTELDAVIPLRVGERVIAPFPGSVGILGYLPLSGDGRRRPSPSANGG